MTGPYLHKFIYGKYCTYTICSYLFVLLDNFTGCDWTGETWSCCSRSHPCGIFEGDCDGNDEYADNLVCGSFSCLDSFPPDADCCIEF